MKSAGTGLGALLGSSVLGKRGWLRPDPVSAKESSNAVTLRTHEWFGDIDETMAFPPDWEVQVQYMKGHDSPVLNKNEIRGRIQNPIGTKTLRELAAGKRKVIITFDDLTRPTPTYAVAPLIVEELLSAGIPEEGILFLTSYGTHEHMNQTSTAAKLGLDMVRRFPWLNHNIHEHNIDVGTTSFGNRIRIDPNFVKADLRVCISGIMYHPSAGYGGGGKAVLPGVSSLSTIDYNHNTIARGNKTVGVGKIYTNEVRKDMEEAARFANVDFSIQIVFNGRREPVAIYAGDIIDAYREACTYAANHYVTEVAQKADVVISNSYPQCKKAGGGLTWARKSLNDGGTVVLIIQNPMGMTIYHGLTERQKSPYTPYLERMPRPDRSAVENAGKIIVLSQYMQKIDFNVFAQKNLIPMYSWEDVMKDLKKDFPDGARVAVYPYSTIQHEPLKLDLPGIG